MDDDEVTAHAGLGTEAGAGVPVVEGGADTTGTGREALGRPVPRSAVRLSDVATAAGVSQKTVSNVVNDYPFVSERTRARVTAAIERLGYRPNLSARNLARGRTGVVALVLPELSNPYFSHLAGLMLDEVERLSLAVLIEQTRGERGREEAAISQQRSRLVDGIIMSVSSLSGEDLAQRTGTTPLVVLGERVFNGPVDHVAGDNVAAARELTHHLIEQGRHRIAVIGMERALEPGLVTLRRRGHLEALEQAGIEPDPALFVEVPSLTREYGQEATAQLLAAGASFDGILCFNDLLAIGAMKALDERGVRVPDDVAVAGFDNIRDGSFTSPGLTTVDWDEPRIVKEAIDLLDKRLGPGKDEPPVDLVVAHRLVVRGSTVPEG